MTHSTAAAQNWTTPELNRLGTIKDVAGSTGTAADGQSINPKPAPAS